MTGGFRASGHLLIKTLRMKNWIKKQLGLVDTDGVEMVNYLLMKVDYLSSRVNELENERKRTLKDLIRLDETVDENTKNLVDFERKVRDLKDEIVDTNFGYMWEKIDELETDLGDLEIPTNDDIRDVVSSELDELTRGSQELNSNEEDLRKMILSSANDLIEYKIARNNYETWSQLKACAQIILEDHSEKPLVKDPF